MSPRDMAETLLDEAIEAEIRFREAQREARERADAWRRTGKRPKFVDGGISTAAIERDRTRERLISRLTMDLEWTP